MKGEECVAETAFEEEPRFYKAAPYNPEKSASSQEGGYLGSVRFFKHLLLTVLALLILIPTMLSIVFGVLLRRTRVELNELQLEIDKPQSSASQVDRTLNSTQVWMPTLDY